MVSKSSDGTDIDILSQERNGERGLLSSIQSKRLSYRAGQL